MSVVYVRLAERPDLASVMWSMPNPWPAYMNQDPVADVFFLRLHEVFPEHQLLALDERGAVVGKANSLPFAWTGVDDDLPARGWDAVLERGFTDHARGAKVTAVSLLEARVVAEHRSSGLSPQLLTASCPALS